MIAYIFDNNKEEEVIKNLSTELFEKQAENSKSITEAFLSTTNEAILERIKAKEMSITFIFGYLASILSKNSDLTNDVVEKLFNLIKQEKDVSSLVNLIKIVYLALRDGRFKSWVIDLLLKDSLLKEVSKNQEIFSVIIEDYLKLTDRVSLDSLELLLEKLSSFNLISPFNSSITKFLNSKKIIFEGKPNILRFVFMNSSRLLNYDLSEVVGLVEKEKNGLKLENEVIELYKTKNLEKLLELSGQEKSVINFCYMLIYSILSKLNKSKFTFQEIKENLKVSSN